MKKILLISLVLILLIIGGAAAYGYYYVNTTFGLSEAEAIGYEDVLNDNTRLIAMVQPMMAIPFLRPMIPTKLASLPSWVPWEPGQLLDKGAPREVTLLAGTDPAAGRIPFMVFVNERIGGPIVAAQMAAQEFFSQPGTVQWDAPAVTLPRRGQLETRGSFPYPQEIKTQVQTMFRTAKSGASAETLTREHLFEAVLDNREGDFLAFIGTATALGGGSLDEMLADPNVGPIITHCQNIRLTADITGPDEMTIAFRMGMIPETPLQVRLAMLFAVNEIAFPALKNGTGPLYDGRNSDFRGLEGYGLTLDWKQNKADFKDGALIGECILSGFRPQIEAFIAANIR
ncbi:MAG: hypothetical protein GC168_05460 [Candidatus Hydrogenedens sp.]|nr:hypothetical protein [Candidatus Hydrogenedens sp.]